MRIVTCYGVGAQSKLVFLPRSNQRLRGTFRPLFVVRTGYLPGTAVMEAVATLLLGVFSTQRGRTPMGF